ncbi:RWD domain-containing protein 1 [Sciurus carolinensis]|uniref:RWD domain-containing protein 1 n=1 Tax=Sciurus carolinensis TaxID=30640 RepID=A0AA41SWK1_SCICA|nr:RWD domain-containing protein 1 [Sciurus carolinensis]
MKVRRKQNIDKDRILRSKLNIRAFFETSTDLAMTERENFLSWKAKFDAEFLEIKNKWMKEEEQAGKNKLSGKQLFEIDHNLDASDIQFLEDARNNVEVGESLSQEMDDLEVEDDEDDPDYNPADPGNDLAD